MAERILETFVGYVDSVRDGVAYITLTTEEKETLYGEYPMAEFEKLGIREGRRFECETVKIDGGPVEVRMRPVPDIVLTEEQERAIDQRLDELFRDDDFDGDC